MTDHEWQIALNRWARGIDWCVTRIGRNKWEVGGTFGKGWPLFRTKKAAGEAIDRFILLHSDLRRRKQFAQGSKP